MLSKPFQLPLTCSSCNLCTHNVGYWFKFHCSMTHLRALRPLCDITCPLFFVVSVLLLLSSVESCRNNERWTRALFSSVVLCVLQAQARMQESSQKVDLLRLSLEKRLSELPEDHPKYAAIEEELSFVALPSYGTPKKQFISNSSSSCSSFFFKPASLTGC